MPLTEEGRLLTAILEIFLLLNRNTDAIPTLAGEVNVLRADLNALRGEFMGMKEQITELQARDVDVATALTGVETALAAEKLEIDAIVARLTELETSGTEGLGALITSAQERASKLAALTSGIAGLVTVNQTPADTEIPLAPGALTAGNLTASSVDLSWQPSTDNIGVTGYIVYKDGAEAGKATSTSFSVTDLTSATPYSFAVAAFDAAGNVSPQSEVTMITTA